MSKRITVYDIADELGISPSTVSRVLNNSSLISNERSRQILETAERLGYQKRSIKKHVSRAILNIHLFLPQTDNHLTHFFYNISELIESIQTGFGDVKLNIITRVNDGNLDFLQRKKTGHIDACLFAFTTPDAALAEELSNRSIPFVLLNRLSDDHDYIAYDIRGGMELLAESVIKSKGSDIKPCYIGFSKLPAVSSERSESLFNYFASAGIPFGAKDIYNAVDLENIAHSAPDWIRAGGYDAVFAFNDLAALSIYSAMRERGLEVPEDFSLTGFDDSPIQKLLSRKIDTIGLSIPLLGKKAGQWLKGTIIDREEGRLREILPTQYVRGDTV